MAKGIIAELQRMSKQAAREKQRAQMESHKAYLTALNNAKVARILCESAILQAQKASAADKKRFEKEAKIAHEEEMTAKVESLNLELAEIEAEFSGLLSSTLSVDDFVDLNTLRVKAEHPAFDRSDLLIESQPALPRIDPPVPVLVQPQPLRGVMSFLGKKGHEKKLLEAQAKHEAEMNKWQVFVDQNEKLREHYIAAYHERENERLIALENEQARYSAECVQREETAHIQNQAIDELIVNLGYGTKEAIEEYIDIVLSNAIYPECFPIRYGFIFEPSDAELRLRVAVIPPDKLLTLKNYKYTKSTDIISSVKMSDKACKDRYTSAIYQVSLRVPHEIFEADRRGLINTISLELGTETNDPATGKEDFIPFVALGVSREEFMKIDLANIVPAATLAHLGASISKNPYGLVAVNTSGVRRT